MVLARPREALPATASASIAGGSAVNKRGDNGLALGASMKLAWMPTLCEPMATITRRHMRADE
jgi:hypothetical protein